MAFVRHFRLLLAAILLAFAPAIAANPVVTENVTASLIADHQVIAPGDGVEIALVLDMRPGWHTYWKNPGDSGEPTRIDWLLPDGVTAGPIRWGYPELIRVGPLANYGYSGQAVHLVRLQTTPDWPAGRPLDVEAKASWLVCEEHCIPESATLRLNLPTSNRSEPADAQTREIFARTNERLPRPFSGSAELSVREAEPMRLAVGTEQLVEQAGGAPRTAWFFPEGWGLIEHAAEQPWRLKDGRLLVELTPGSAGDQISPNGVLVVEGAGETLAFELSPNRVSAVGGLARPSGPDGIGLPLALGFALLGGLILNLMPCVFPVLAMKALSLARTENASVRERALSGFAYSAGVLAFFAAVAAVLLFLRAGGAAVGWGYQLQHPPFVALMAYLFLVLGLSLAGSVTLGTGLMGLGAAGPTRGAWGAFVTGGLAALVAAPCTAPFMGAALGYAVTLAWPLALAVMLTLGLGLALPYLVFALVPSTGKILPKPGRWMENLRQFLAFPMFATAAWLVWVLSVQTGPPGVAAVLAGMVLLGCGLWFLERARESRGRVRLLAGSVAASSLAAGLILGLGTDRLGAGAAPPRAAAQSEGAVLAAQTFSIDRLRSARAEGQPVFVNMTAAWCITCLVNERVALSSAAVADAFASGEVLYLKGDWTNQDPTITEYLAGFGRNGVPLYVYYPPGGQPRVLPQILTESAVLGALEPVLAEAGAPGRRS